ncbi:hypothetical protein BN133_3706 [Cronobacter dublinensis 582]|nr:hypothetical protein BN133_3706 [Cronobacter dublinensis 582]
MLLPDFIKQLRFAGEVPVHRAACHFCGARDISKRGMRHTALGKRKDSGIDQLLARFQRLLLCSPGHKSPRLFLADIH